MNNIKQLREKHNESANELGKAIGKSQSTISKWENKSILKYEEARLIATHYQVPISAVLGNNEIEDDILNYASIDIIDAQASCGNGIENFNPVVIGKQLISYPSLRDLTFSTPENIKILRARGDSMEPTINDADYIWVDISCKQADSDGIYVFCIGTGIIAKRVRIDFIHKNAVILSDNPKYPPIQVGQSDQVKVIGRVISICKMLG